MLVEIIEVLSILLALAPVIFQVFKLIAQMTNSRKLKNLSERSSIIVAALEQSGYSNEVKKSEAFKKLSLYALEVGIEVTPDQVDDYVESAVKFLKLLSK